MPAGDAWTEEEERKLLRLVRGHGSDWKTISELIGNDRSARAVKEKFYRYQQTVSPMQVLDPPPWDYDDEVPSRIDLNTDQDVHGPQLLVSSIHELTIYTTLDSTPFPPFPLVSTRNSDPTFI